MKEKYKILAPINNTEKLFLKVEELKLFDNEILSFISSFSTYIFLHPIARIKYPELIQLAFFFRRAALDLLKKKHEDLIKTKIIVPKGVVFHVAPSNVDTIFIYSLFLSMLMGNKNIVRISSKESEQVDLIITAINETIKTGLFPIVSKNFIIVQYDYNDEVTEHFSNLCDLRVIWGGDGTIKRIRQIPLNPLANEITFADKFSYSIIDPSTLETESDFEKLVSNYYNDSFIFNQMACSSSRAVFWVGEKEKIQEKREKFWFHLEKIVKRKHKLIEDSVKMDKINNIYLLAMLNNNIKIIKSSDNIINRVEVKSSELYRDHNKGGGIFLEYFLENLEDILSFITKKDQTVGIFGIPKQKIVDLISKNNLHGINRIVSIGKALNFSPIWDSYNLLYEFSKEIEIDI